MFASIGPAVTAAARAAAPHVGRAALATGQVVGTCIIAAGVTGITMPVMFYTMDKTFRVLDRTDRKVGGWRQKRALKRQLKRELRSNPYGETKPANDTGKPASPEAPSAAAE